MSSTSIQLFRQHTEKQRQTQELRYTARPSEDPTQPSLIAKMSRIQHEVRQVFGDASAADRENIIRFLELLVRNLRREG